MRVHLGSDHAGLDLKAHLIGWLTEHGYEPVDHGPFVYDAVDDYPVFCLRAAEAVAQERADGQDSLGVVIGGSGNGEQMAANKVAGIRCALAWSEETAALGREHNDAQVVSVGGRMHSLEDMTRFVEVFLSTPFSGDERHARRIGQLASYEQTRELPPLPDSAPRYPDRVPEGHTLHRLASALGEAFAGHQVRASSPQGRFAESAALLDGRVLGAAEAYGKHLFMTFDDDRRRARPPRAVREVRRAPRRPRGAGARGPGAAAARRRRRRTPTCAAPPPASCSPRPSGTAVLARLGPDPLRADADPDAAWQRIRRSRAPIGGLLMDQTVVAGIGNVYRAELLYRHRVDPFRPGRSLRARQWQEMWDDLVALMEDGVRSGRIDTVRPEHLTDAELGARQSDAGPRRGHSYVYRRAGEPCRVCGSRVRTQVLQAGTSTGAGSANGAIGARPRVTPRTAPRARSGSRIEIP